MLIEIGLAAVLALFAFFIMEGVRIALVALPLAVLAGLLLLRPNMPGVKRAVLLMIGTGLALTLAVEVITLRGDIGRMNTIFKLYMQVWMLFAVSAAAAFGWLLDAFPYWTSALAHDLSNGFIFIAGGRIPVHGHCHDRQDQRPHDRCHAAHVGWHDLS